MSTLYAIPGLMTAPTAPKAANRLEALPGGTVYAVLHRSTRGNDRVCLRVIKPALEGKFEHLIYDPLGTTLLRYRKSDSLWEYVWLYDSLSARLPAGDLQVWIDVPRQSRKVYSLSIPEQIVDSPPRAEGRAGPDIVDPESPTEQQWGSAAIAASTPVLDVVFPSRFVNVPNVVLVSLTAPADLSTIEVVALVVSGVSETGFQVALTSPLSISGYQVSWSASYAPSSQQTITNQSGQVLVPDGAVGVSVSYRLPAPSIPIVVGSVQALTVVNQVQVLTHIIHSVTTTGFQVLFSPSSPDDFFFNWEMHV